ncbi:MAG: ABC transporter permease [Anaerolineae bacterium]|nr:ABC transporter permease [Anaerolineae bacterium]
MFRYIVRRLIQAIPIFFGITILSFALMSASGNPVAALTFRPGMTPEERDRIAARLGVNDPWPIQYLRWLAGDDWMRWDSTGDGIADHAILVPLDANGDGEPEPPGDRRGILRGDFGTSFTKKRPALDILVERLPATLELSIAAFLLGTPLGILIGIIAAINHGKWFDNVSRILAVAFTAIPTFWFAIMLLLIFSVQLRLLPIGDRCKTSLDDSCPPVTERLQYMVLPVIVLSIGSIAGYSRVMRASMLDVISADYVRTARAKGLTRRMTWIRHAARNALIPIATALGPELTFLLSGAVVTETIFNYPGVGLTSFAAVTQRDYPVVMTVTIYAAVATIIGYLLSDIMYGLIDPRIRFD